MESKLLSISELKKGAEDMDNAETINTAGGTRLRTGGDLDGINDSFQVNGKATGSYSDKEELLATG